MSKEWKGVFPAVTTKFTDDDSLDIEGMAKNFEAQLRAGVHGLIVVGSLGENGVLSADEKQEVLKLAVSSCVICKLAGFRGSGFRYTC